MRLYEHYMLDLKKKIRTILFPCSAEVRPTLPNATLKISTMHYVPTCAKMKKEGEHVFVRTETRLIVPYVFAIRIRPHPTPAPRHSCSLFYFRAPR